MIATLKHSAAAMLVTAAVLCASAWGQTSEPTSRPTTRGGGAADMSKRLVGPSDGDRIDAAPRSPWAQWGRTMAALAIVVVLIFAAGIILKRFSPVSGPQKRQVLEVLARTTVSPRHQLLLVKVGKRVVLVGQTQASLAALSEVTDADEVAALIEATGGADPEKTADSAPAREGDA